MKPIIRHVYVKKKIRKQPRMEYDKTSKERPAWIEIKSFPETTRFVSIGYKHRIPVYMTYLKGGLFLPIDYTKEEMKKFYDKWAETYDKEIITGTFNRNAAEFLVSLLDKHKVSKNIEILDLGAGTGILDEVLVKHGYKNITLVDYSREMLAIAKKNSLLKGCKFVETNIMKLDLKKKYDLITSMFSFGSSTYFNKEDMKVLFRIINKHLKKNGLFLSLGHFKSEGVDYSIIFREIESGEYKLSDRKDWENRFWTDYFLGRRR